MAYRFITWSMSAFQIYDRIVSIYKTIVKKFTYSMRVALLRAAYLGGKSVDIRINVMRLFGGHSP